MALVVAFDFARRGFVPGEGDDGMPGGLDLSAAAENAPQNSGRERDSLITVEISLIARFNSLQGAQKIPCSDA